MLGLGKIAFNGATGDPAYDGITFSGRPSARWLGGMETKLGVVHHLGVATDATVTAMSCNEHADVLVLNLSNEGYYTRHEGRRAIRKKLVHGQISFVPATEERRLTFPASQSALLATFPRGVLRAACAEQWDGDFAPMHSEMHPRLQKLLAIVEDELRHPGFGGDLLIDGAVRAIAAVLTRENQDAVVKEAERLHLTPAKLRAVTEYVEAHLTQEITLAELAGAANLSPFHFSRVFKRQTGVTPYRYVCLRRVERAITLLRDGDLPLTEVALLCGFSSQSHFTSAFVKVKGIAPGRYRRSLGLATPAAEPDDLP